MNYPLWSRKALVPEDKPVKLCKKHHRRPSLVLHSYLGKTSWNSYAEAVLKYPESIPLCSTRNSTILLTGGRENIHRALGLDISDSRKSSEWAKIWELHASGSWLDLWPAFHWRPQTQGLNKETFQAHLLLVLPTFKDSEGKHTRLISVIALTELGYLK